jgi:benzoyl-CoA-dihydrodiol lyase
LALACDEIVLVDDRSSSVSLPEVPLLGVLPGTGGLTRLTAKRRVRRDHADIFCTTAEGVQGQRAKDWRLVDEIVPPQQFSEYVRKRAVELARSSDRPSEVEGVPLAPLKRTIDETGYHYEYVDARLDRSARIATITVRAPAAVSDFSAGAAWWPLAMSRELDDAILNLRTNEPEIGLWLLKTVGDPNVVLAFDALMLEHASHWFVREVIGHLRRTLARLDVTSRSMYAVIEPGSCFAGSLLELALAADRAYMLDEPGNEIALSEMNFGSLTAVNRSSRIANRSYQAHEPIEALRTRIATPMSARQALESGLVTSTPDDLDWADELRLAIEGRASLSPDALTGLEANLRFGDRETMETQIFGRLSAWQNWIFGRPNAVGAGGALKVYGTGARPKFDWERI